MSNKSYDKGIEKDVNRAILSNRGAINVVMRYSDSPNLMKDPKQNLVWRAGLALAKENKQVDPSLVRTKVLQEGMATETQIDNILHELTSVSESDANIEDWASELYGMYAKRKSIRIFGEAKQRLKRTGKVSDVQDWVSNEMSDLSLIRSGEDLETVSENVIKDIEKYRNAGRIRSGIKLGFPEFDRITNGVGSSYLTIVAAVPKAGKTTFAWQSVDHILETTDKRVMFVSLEMREHIMIERWLSMRSMVDGSKIQSAQLSDEEWARVQEAHEQIHQWIAQDRIRFVTQQDIPGAVTADKIRNAVISEHSKRELDYCVVDYFQLISYGNTEEAEAAAHVINSIPKSLGISTMLLSQFNRGSRRDNREPRPSDMHSTSALENDLDILVILDRKDMRIPKEQWGSQGVIENQIGAHLALNRHGQTGRWTMQMAKNCPIFTVNNTVSADDFKDESAFNVESIL